MGCVVLSFVVGLTILGMLVGGAGLVLLGWQVLPCMVVTDGWSAGKLLEVRD